MLSTILGRFIRRPLALALALLMCCAGGVLLPVAAEEQGAAAAPSFYDDANPERAGLQRAADAFAALPRDARGGVDWMKALREGAIKPRASLHGDQPQQILDLDIILKNTRDMPYVKFPHNSHTQWLACSNCHNEIFVPKAGANPISMDKIFRGQYCGTCHDRVAFVTHLSCERCHSVPHGSVKKWW